MEKERKKTRATRAEKALVKVKSAARHRKAEGKARAEKGGSGDTGEKLCVNFVAGGCCSREGCTYKHARPTHDTEEKYYRDLHTRFASRSKSPGPNGKGKGDGLCKLWKKDGSCNYGDNFWYKHEGNAAAPAPKKGKKGRNRSRGSSRGRSGSGAAAAVPPASGDS